MLEVDARLTWRSVGSELVTAAAAATAAACTRGHPELEGEGSANWVYLSVYGGRIRKVLVGASDRWRGAGFAVRRQLGTEGGWMSEMAASSFLRGHLRMTT